MPGVSLMQLFVSLDESGRVDVDHDVQEDGVGKMLYLGASDCGDPVTLWMPEEMADRLAVALVEKARGAAIPRLRDALEHAEFCVRTEYREKLDPSGARVTDGRDYGYTIDETFCQDPPEGMKKIKGYPYPLSLAKASIVEKMRFGATQEVVGDLAEAARKAGEGKLDRWARDIGVDYAADVLWAAANALMLIWDEEEVRNG